MALEATQDVRILPLDRVGRYDSKMRIISLVAKNTT